MRPNEINIHAPAMKTHVDKVVDDPSFQAEWNAKYDEFLKYAGRESWAEHAAWMWACEELRRRIAEKLTATPASPEP